MTTNKLRRRFLKQAAFSAVAFSTSGLFAEELGRLILTWFHAIAEQSLDASVPITSASLAARMKWPHSDEVVCPVDGHRRIRFQLRRAKLYAFWIE